MSGYTKLCLDGQRQQDFETDLAVRDISLGEYMEIVEQAAMEACARTETRDSSLLDEQELLGIASAMLTDYVSRKRLLAGHSWEGNVARLSESPSQPSSGRQLAADIRKGIALARHLQLRAVIDSRIEAIKGGLIKP
jgi:hypothetical protein